MIRERVTVLVPTYNRGDFIVECLESLLGQTLPPHEVIVIDDGCTDETPALLGKFQNRIRVIDTPHFGKPEALNRGLAHVSGEYVWIFDDDDVALPDALERFVEPFREDPGLGFTYSHFWNSPSRDDKRIGEPRSKSRLPDVPRDGFLPPLMEANFLGGAALFAKTSCYAEVGKFDAALLRSQDYEMALRIAMRFRGQQVRGGPTFHYRQHDGLRGNRADRFIAERRHSKWLEYDQMFFRRLYRELPIEVYLRPRWTLATHQRAAILQRAAIMASKDLWREVAEDLGQVAGLPGVGSLLPEELDLIRRGLVLPSWYGAGVLEFPQFREALRELNERSAIGTEIYAVIRNAVRREMLREGRVLAARAFALDSMGVKAAAGRILKVVKQLASG